MLCRLASQRALVGSARHARCTAVRVMASAAAAPTPAKYHLLEYSYVPDILEKRGPYRADHLAAANKQARAVAVDRGASGGSTDACGCCRRRCGAGPSSRALQNRRLGWLASHRGP
jgi:hypothetical protein